MGRNSIKGTFIHIYLQEKRSQCIPFYLIITTLILEMFFINLLHSSRIYSNSLQDRISSLLKLCLCCNRVSDKNRHLLVTTMSYPLPNKQHYNGARGCQGCILGNNNFSSYPEQHEHQMMMINLVQMEYTACG